MPEIKVKLNFYAIELNGDKKLKSKYFLVSQQTFTCRNEARVYKPFYVTDKESFCELRIGQLILNVYLTLERNDSF